MCGPSGRGRRRLGRGCGPDLFWLWHVYRRLGLHNGLEKVGAAIVPSSTGNTQKQLMYMKDFETTLLVATPSYAMRIAEVALEMGINPRKD